MLHLRWNDTRLAWNANRLEVTVVETESIWYPRLAQYSNMGLDEIYFTEGIGRMIQVFSDGTVYWQLSSSSVGARGIVKFFIYKNFDFILQNNLHAYGSLNYFFLIAEFHC